MSKSKMAVPSSLITFKRDSDDDGVYEVVGTFSVKLVLDRVNPLEVPLRYAVAGRSSYAPVRLVFPEQVGVPIQEGDIFLYEGRYGVVTMVVPNELQQTEARAIVDFGGVN